jgi:hypothetical protein
MKKVKNLAINLLFDLLNLYKTSEENKSSNNTSCFCLIISTILIGLKDYKPFMLYVSDKILKQLMYELNTCLTGLLPGLIPVVLELLKNNFNLTQKVYLDFFKAIFIHLTYNKFIFILNYKMECLFYQIMT